MFSTIKKNILTPLLPKVNEVEDEVGKKSGAAKVEVIEDRVIEAKSQDANLTEPSTSPTGKPEKEKSKTAKSKAGDDSNIVVAPESTEPSTPQTSSKSNSFKTAPTPVEKVQHEPTHSVEKPTSNWPKSKEEAAKSILIDKKEINMGNINSCLEELMKIDGAVGVAVVDSESGMALGTAGGGGLSLEMAAAGNSEVVKAKMKVRDALGLKDSIDDILITLTSQYHLIRPLSKAKNLFIYLVLNRQQANLAMARMKLAGIEGTLEI